jgi:hypothetical protein
MQLFLMLLLTQFHQAVDSGAAPVTEAVYRAVATVFKPYPCLLLLLFKLFLQFFLLFLYTISIMHCV